MEKRKVNILYTSSFPSLKGGGQRSLLLLLKNLDKGKFNPYLIVPAEGELSAAAREKGVAVIVFTFSQLRSLNILRIIGVFRRFYHICKELGIDIIHADAPRETIYAGMLKRFLRVPVILHLRVSESAFLLDRMIYRLSDRLIAVSQAVARRFKWEGANGKIRVVYNAADLEEFAVRRPFAGGKLRVGYFGRILSRKGVEVLIKALARIKDIAELVIVGDGEKKYVAGLQKMADGLPVSFEAYQPDVREKMSAVDVIVLPSILGEGLSRIIIEGMLLGKVVAVSDLDENLEALGNDLAGFSFKKGNDMELALLLKKIHDHPPLAGEFALKARKRAERLFDAKSNTRQIERIYEEVLLEREDFKDVPEEDRSYF